MSHYIYGFIESAKPCCFGPIGIRHQEEVSTIGFKDIAAIVSQHPVIEFDCLDRPRLTAIVRGHQLVIEKVALNHTIIPLQFGTIVESELALRRMLEQAYIQLKTLFHHIRGKIELVIQVSAKKQAWIQEFAKTNPQIIALTGKLGTLPENEKKRVQIEIGKIIFESVAEREKQLSEDILNTLRNGGINCKSGQLLSKEMFLNASFLIDKKSEAVFDKKVNMLARKYENVVDFKYIGPMPPVSFVNLQLEKTDYELINQARQRLGLPEHATMFEIKTAYRKLAARFHPDQNKDSADAEQNFKEIAEAYRVLETYCQNYRYSFSRTEIGNTVLVNEPT